MSSPSDLPSPRLWLDGGVLARLRAEEPPPLPAAVGPVQALEERAGEDPGARAWLEAFAEARRQADRVTRALAHEQVQVVLADGSALALEDAEKMLAHKEEVRAHVALRRFVDEACGKSLRFDDFRSGNREAIDAKARALLEGTRAARDAARDMLATLAREPLESPPALARALDLPSGSGAFSEASALALVRSARDAAPEAVRPVRRIRVPRRLTGIVLEKAEGVHFGTGGPILRFDRHRAALWGGARSVLKSLGNHDPHDRAVPSGAFGLGLSMAPVRRAVLDEARDAADAADRLTRAALLLEARLLAALWLAHGRPEGPHEDLDREAAMEALGSDPGRVLVRERAERVDASSVEETLMAPALALVLRDAFDENFALRADAWRLAAEWTPGEPVQLAEAWRAYLLERA